MLRLRNSIKKPKPRALIVDSQPCTWMSNNCGKRLANNVACSSATRAHFKNLRSSCFWKKKGSGSNRKLPKSLQCLLFTLLYQKYLAKLNIVDRISIEILQGGSSCDFFRISSTAASHVFQWSQIEVVLFFFRGNQEKGAFFADSHLSPPLPFHPYANHYHPTLLGNTP